MATLGTSVRTAFLKGLEALGKTASNLTDAAQHKLNEMNLDTRRREVLADIPKCVMQLWEDGVEMPEPLTALLQELTDIDTQLAALRAERETKAAQEQPAEETAEETAPAALEETAEDEAVEAESTEDERQDTL